MASPLALIIPFGLLLIGGGAAAAAAKKKQAAAAGGASAAGAAPSTTTPAPTTEPPSILPAAANAAAAATGVPADVQALVIAAITSRNPETMRRAADQLEAKYPLQAADLRATAATFEAAMSTATQGTTAATAAGAAATPAATAATTAATAAAAQAAQIAQAAAQVGMTPQQFATAAAATGMTAAQAAAIVLSSGITNWVASSLGPPQAPTMPVAVPTTTNVPTPVTTVKPPLATMPTPTATTPPAASDPNRVRAAALVVALKTAKKGTPSEPRAQVKEFQLIERLSRTDGSYGSETALALADKYGIVPPKPLFWGKAGGTYQTLVNDKNAYSAHLLNLAATDPQRADEWRSAAKV